MKQYQLQENYMNYPAGTMLFGPCLTTGGGRGYFTKEDMPGPEGGSQGLFASFVENNSDLFKEVVNSQI